MEAILETVGKESWVSAALSVTATDLKEVENISMQKSEGSYMISFQFLKDHYSCYGQNEPSLDKYGNRPFKRLFSETKADSHGLDLDGSSRDNKKT